MADSSSRGVEVVWRVLPLTAPRILRPCARCNGVRPFASTAKFRLNAQQRHLDVWLLYACGECERTWKREIFQRLAPEEIDADLYERMLRNDPDTAWHFAFTPDRGERFEAGADGVRIEREPGGDSLVPPFRIRLEVPFPIRVRLDRLLASELSLSRSALQRAAERGLIIVADRARALRREIRDGDVIQIGASTA